MNCTMLADLCPCFHRSPTKLCPDLVSFGCWIVPEFWAFARKSVPELVVYALNCARFFCRLRTKLCPISFAPCPFPNLAGTLVTEMTLLADLLNEDGVARDVRQVSELEMERSELGEDRRPVRGPPPVSASTTATDTKQKH